MPDMTRAYRIADALDACPASTGEDYDEASYLRCSYRHDCRPGGPIGPAAARSYLDCAQVRLDRANARAAAALAEHRAQLAGRPVDGVPER